MQASFESVVTLLNTGGWIFDNVDGRYTIGLTVFARSSEHVVRFIGPFNSEKALLAGADSLAEVPEEFGTWSSSAAFPLIPDAASADVFRQMRRSPVSMILDPIGNSARCKVI